MGAYSVARRLCVLVLVAAAHLTALLLVATLTRSERLHLSAQADALLVTCFRRSSPGPATHSAPALTGGKLIAQSSSHGSAAHRQRPRRSCSD